MPRRSRMAMTAAETGHLVLGTLHTTGAVKTIDRIIDALPVEEREQTKSFLAQSLLAVVTQMLVKTADGTAAAPSRGAGDDQGDRQAHHRPNRPTRSRASCRWDATWACSCSTRRCCSASTARADRPRRRLQLRHRQAPVPEIRDRYQHPAASWTPARPRPHPRAGDRLDRTEGRAALHGPDRRLPQANAQASAARTCTSSPAIRRASGCMASSQALRAGDSWPRNSSSRRSTRSCRRRRSSASRARTAPTSPTRSRDKGRFRVNVMRQLNGMGAVFRAIPSQGAHPRSAQHAEAVRQLCRANSGLILVTGKTGSGKSTTRWRR